MHADDWAPPSPSTPFPASPPHRPSGPSAPASRFEPCRIAPGRAEPHQPTTAGDATVSPAVRMLADDVDGRGWMTRVDVGELAAGTLHPAGSEGPPLPARGIPQLNPRNILYKLHMRSFVFRVCRRKFHNGQTPAT